MAKIECSAKTWADERESDLIALLSAIISGPIVYFIKVKYL